MKGKSMRVRGVFVCIAIIGLGLALSGCVASRKAQYSEAVLAKMEAIELMNGEPGRPYMTLGPVEHRFNPLTGGEEAKFTLQEKAYSLYGDVDAIIRVTELMVPGYDFPLREIRGVAVKYK